MLTRRRIRGFTMVELMVTLTIAGILLAIGVPSFATYLQATKLAHAAQSYLSGVQLARAEAIRRNLPAEFILTDTPIGTANIENVAALNVNGRNWVVRVPSLTTPGTFDLIEAKSALEGSFSTTGPLPVQVFGTGTLAGFDGTISFNGFGGTTTAGGYALDLKNPSGGACAPAGPMRCPRIQVGGGGQVTLCDPNAAAGDSRRCPP